jgi:hypothetical protein
LKNPDSSLREKRNIHISTRDEYIQWWYMDKELKEAGNINTLFRVLFGIKKPELKVGFHSNLCPEQDHSIFACT